MWVLKTIRFLNCYSYFHILFVAFSKQWQTFTGTVWHLQKRRNCYIRCAYLIFKPPWLENEQSNGLNKTRSACCFPSEVHNVVTMSIGWVWVEGKIYFRISQLQTKCIWWRNKHSLNWFFLNSPPYATCQQNDLVLYRFDVSLISSFIHQSI